LELFGAQNELAQAIFRLGKPVVVYLMNGKPLAIPEIAAKADAIVEGWYMGQETGTAAANVLFGDVNPSGKLTMTFPRSTGQLPVYYNRKPGSRTLDYVDETSQPLFPFGFGLSYTTFTYSTPKLSSPTMTADGNSMASVTVTNTGKVAGDEIVQLYIRDRISSVTRPIKELKGFQRVSLKPGESREVTFSIDRQALSFHGIDLKPVVDRFHSAEIQVSFPHEMPSHSHRHDGVGPRFRPGPVTAPASIVLRPHGHPARSAHPGVW
jgi:beta-glucosidase